MVGLVANMIREQPPFFLPSLIAGLAWSVGTWMKTTYTMHTHIAVDNILQWIMLI